MSEQYDNTYRPGDAITFLLKNKPFIDLGVPPSANDYRDAGCVTVAVYDTTLKEKLVQASDMKKVPNRPGWYYFRFQTTANMKPGVYTAVFTAITRIDGEDFTSKSVQEFRLTSEGIL
jgi:hypothetical protein